MKARDLIVQWIKKGMEWDESKHPRDEKGRFAPKHGQAAAASGVSSATPPPDPLARRRGHKLLDAETLRRLPPLYSQEKNPDPVVQAKFFSPYGNMRWYATEYDPEQRVFFGYIDSNGERELGYFGFDELANATVWGGVPAVERDLYFQPKPLSRVKREELGKTAQNKRGGAARRVIKAWLAKAAEWDESKHPRDEKGRFTEKHGGAEGKKYGALQGGFYFTSSWPEFEAKGMPSVDYRGFVKYGYTRPSSTDNRIYYTIDFRDPPVGFEFYYSLEKDGKLTLQYANGGSGKEKDNKVSVKDDTLYFGNEPAPDALQVYAPYVDMMMKYGGDLLHLGASVKEDGAVIANFPPYIDAELGRLDEKGRFQPSEEFEKIKEQVAETRALYQSYWGQSDYEATPSVSFDRDKDGEKYAQYEDADLHVFFEMSDGWYDPQTEPIIHAVAVNEGVTILDGDSLPETFKDRFRKWLWDNADDFMPHYDD